MWTSNISTKKYTYTFVRPHRQDAQDKFPSYHLIFLCYRVAEVSFFQINKLNKELHLRITIKGQKPLTHIVKIHFPCTDDLLKKSWLTEQFVLRNRSDGQTVSSDVWSARFSETRTSFSSSSLGSKTKRIRELKKVQLPLKSCF